jgi:DNA-binding NarL/FixJ family response regulator
MLCRPPASGARELSAREERVLRLLAEGYSTKEVAERMAVSVKTVETYKARGMEKIGGAGRVDLMRYATKHGWLKA